MYHVVGLGNPGDTYVHTRHNVGWRVLDVLHAHTNASEWHKDALMRAQVADAVIAEKPVRLIKPQTFMNESGYTVSRAISKSDDTVVLVHDDLDLPLGSLRISFGRGAGGHRGVASVIQSIGTSAFPRVRIGIAPREAAERPRPSGERAVEEFVLGSFSAHELDAVTRAVFQAMQAVIRIVSVGYEAAMRDVNSRR